MKIPTFTVTMGNHGGKDIKAKTRCDAAIKWFKMNGYGAKHGNIFYVGKTPMDESLFQYAGITVKVY